jgi:urease accessory protein
MNAHARIVATRDGMAVLKSEAPLVLRDTPRGVYLVGGAAGPIGGDELSLDIRVECGASLTLRTAAVQVALPGVGPSRFTVRAAVATGGSLQWLPEPSVAAKGCRHTASVELAIDAGAYVVWRDEVVLGRDAEPSGSWCSRIDVEIEGRPVLRQQLRLGEADGPAVVGDARSVGSVLLVGRSPSAEPTAECAVLELACGGSLVTAVAPDALALRRRLVAAIEAEDACRAMSLA